MLTRNAMPVTSVRGFTILEVLVAVLILSIGILGLASAMITGLKSDKSAYYRSQASVIAWDMADRLRLNAANADAYVNLDTESAAANEPTCTTSNAGCTPAQIAQLDAYEWASNFENLGNNNGFSPKLPNGRGQVLRTNNVYTVLITWREDDWDQASAAGRSTRTASLSVELTL